MAMDYVQRSIKPDSTPTVGGVVTLSINGKSVGNGTLENVVPFCFSAIETLDIGMDLEADGRRQ